MFKINDWISQDSKVLDLGCGDGSLLNDLRKEKSVSGLGIEIDSEKIKITKFNLNDQTVAAISVIDRPFFGVQYHPEASPGPHDADHHFNHFVTLIEERRRIVD